LLDGGDLPEKREALMRALGRASGTMRREVSQRLGLRFAPELRFVYDEGVDHEARIEQLLAEIESERRPR
jgi:ribosome-binding factor A